MSDAQAIHTYVMAQIKKVSELDVKADNKGIKLQIARAHKEGYVEALRNVEEVLRRYAGI